MEVEIEEEDVKKKFNKLDKDGSGTVSWEEAARHAEKAYDGEESEDEEEEEENKASGIYTTLTTMWEAVFGDADDDEEEELIPEDQVR